MTSLDEVYYAIKVNDIDKVKEYLESLPNELNKHNIELIKSLFYYALDWKQVDIVEYLVQYYQADPEWEYRFTLYYTSWNTNKLPTLTLSEYIYYGKTNK